MTERMIDSFLHLMLTLGGSVSQLEVLVPPVIPEVVASGMHRTLRPWPGSMTSNAMRQAAVRGLVWWERLQHVLVTCSKKALV